MSYLNEGGFSLDYLFFQEEPGARWAPQLPIPIENVAKRDVFPPSSDRKLSHADSSLSICG